MNKQKNASEKPYRSRGGIHVPHMKGTADKESIRMPIPETVTIPMQMHIGAPCKPTVAVGDTVLVGQKIGESEAPVSSPIHASVSGKVTAIRSATLASGAKCEAIVIESDGEMTPAPLTPPTVTDRASFVRAVRECGLVGLGGAGFPTHIKLNVPEGKNVDTLLINASECEPYLTSDNREIIENAWDVMSGIYAVKNILGIKNVIIGVESNKPEAIALLRQIADSSVDENDEVRVLSLPASYPQGAEKILIKSATGREVPPGKLPADVGCVVLNVTSVAVLARYLKTGMPLTEKRITVDGGAIESPVNVIAPIGTSVSEILSFVGVKGEIKKLILGGPMMGTSLADAAVPVVKNTGGIIAMDEKEARLSESTACIRCARCVHACPMGLMPLSLERAVLREDAEALGELNVMNCMECGSCAFVCPAKRPLVQSMRLGKGILRAKSAKK